jgi:hypothetical protein
MSSVIFECYNMERSWGWIADGGPDRINSCPRIQGDSACCASI